MAASQTTEPILVSSGSGWSHARRSGGGSCAAPRGDVNASRRHAWSGDKQTAHGRHTSAAWPLTSAHARGRRCRMMAPNDNRIRDGDAGKAGAKPALCRSGECDPRPRVRTPASVLAIVLRARGRRLLRSTLPGARDSGVHRCNSRTHRDKTQSAWADTPSMWNRSTTSYRLRRDGAWTA